MGFASIFATIAFMLIFIAGIAYFATVQRNIAHTAQAYNEQTQMTKKIAGEDIEITTAFYQSSPVVPWIDDLYAEFMLGNFSGGTTAIGEGSVQINSTPYSSSTYLSQEIDTGFAGTNYTTISWTSLAPALTNITFQVRSGASLVALRAASFTGPDGTAGTQYASSGASLHASVSNNRFFQYRAHLNTGDNTRTPTLQRVAVGIQRSTGVITLNVTNTGTVKLDPDQTDAYVDAVRVLRNNTARTSHLYDTAGQALWDPGEVMELNIFDTLTGSTSVSVANDATSDATVVS